MSKPVSRTMLQYLFYVHYDDGRGEMIHIHRQVLVTCIKTMSSQHTSIKAAV